MKNILLLLLVILVSSCTSVTVNQLDATYNIKHVCIEENPKVIVSQFLGVIEDGFQNHSITTEVYVGERPSHCEFNLTYTALQSWDITLYLSHAEFRLFKNNSRIAYAEYHLKGKGGFALNKWAGVKSKISPVIDGLLAQY